MFPFGTQSNAMATLYTASWTSNSSIRKLISSGTRSDSLQLGSTRWEALSRSLEDDTRAAIVSLCEQRESTDGSGEVRLSRHFCQRQRLDNGRTVGLLCKNIEPSCPNMCQTYLRRASLSHSWKGKRITLGINNILSQRNCTRPHIVHMNTSQHITHHIMLHVTCKILTSQQPNAWFPGGNPQLGSETLPLLLLLFTKKNKRKLTNGTVYKDRQTPRHTQTYT